MRPLVTAVLVVLANDLLIAALVLPNTEIAFVGFAVIALTLPVYALVSRADSADLSVREEDAEPGQQTRLDEFA